jgi:hypothetical protein
MSLRSLDSLIRERWREVCTYALNLVSPLTQNRFTFLKPRVLSNDLLGQQSRHSIYRASPDTPRIEMPIQCP